jgi:hypothetical protein
MARGVGNFVPFLSGISNPHVLSDVGLEISLVIS